MTSIRSLLIVVLIITGSFLWLHPAQSDDWAELHRIDFDGNRGRSAFPTTVDWTVIVEPQGDQLIVFTSRLIFESSDGLKHVADCGASVMSDTTGGTLLACVMYTNPPECEREDIRAIIIECLTAEGIAKAEARKQAEWEAVEKARQICPLSIPEPGKPFSFALTSIDGEKLTSEGLKGHLVQALCRRGARAQAALPEAQGRRPENYRPQL